ncbi:MAG: SIMPL domain-containing protein [Spirochaetaceae bacterium]|nr:SIMPL domain-containing protein [Spirochaetaceae bacterium]
MFVEFKIDNERINKIIDEVSTKVPCVSINISYSCSHLEKYDKKLIELAIKDAKSKATIIAKASNVNLKQIKTINYSTQQLDVNFGLEYNHLRTDKCFASRVPNMTPENKVLEKSITMIWEIE